MNANVNPQPAGQQPNGQQQSESLFKHPLFPYVLAFIVSVISYAVGSFMDIKKMDYDNTPAGLMRIGIEKQKGDIQEAKVKGTKSPQSAAPVEQKLALVPVEMFSCDKSPAQVNEDLENATLQELNEVGVGYAFGPGCARISLSKDVTRRLTSFRADRYVIRQKDSSYSTGYWGCGTIDGRNDSLAACLQEIRRRPDQPLEVIIISGNFTLN